jgi:hypothetical protein
MLRSPEFQAHLARIREMVESSIAASSSAESELPRGLGPQCG